jgi:hypothetical protein
MEKLNKKEIFNKWVHEETIEEINKFNRKFCSERVEISFKAGLEYAENHYLEVIEEKDKEITKYQKDYIDSSESIGNLGKQLQQAKELLKELYENPNKTEKVRKFLNK